MKYLNLTLIISALMLSTGGAFAQNRQRAGNGDGGCQKADCARPEGGACDGTGVCDGTGNKKKAGKNKTQTKADRKAKRQARKDRKRDGSGNGNGNGKGRGN
jgi:hypothetical protein